LRKAAFLYASGRFGFARAPFKVHRHETFRLALQAGITHGGKPSSGPAIVFKASIFHGFMKALTYIVEHDARFFVASQRKTYIIGLAFDRHAAAFTGIADIAELAKFMF
jgi:hypothetical protein